jgi:hypothetical protein
MSISSVAVYSEINVDDGRATIHVGSIVIDQSWKSPPNEIGPSDAAFDDNPSRRRKSGSGHLHGVSVRLHFRFC